jgi:anti-anti-sigma factor
MNVNAESYGQAVILNCKGELTSDSLSVLKQAVEHQLAEASPNAKDGVGGLRSQVRDVVLNLEQVPFIDSAALEYLLELQQRLLERQGQVKLAAMDENVAKILEITRLESSFERFAELTQAVKTV